MLKKILCLVVILTVLLCVLVVPCSALGSSVGSDSTYPYYYTNDFVWDLQYYPITPNIFDDVNGSADRFYPGDAPFYYGTYVDKVTSTYHVFNPDESVSSTADHFIRRYRFGNVQDDFSLTVPEIRLDHEPTNSFYTYNQAYFGGYSVSTVDNVFKYKTVAATPSLYAPDITYVSTDSMFIAGTNIINDPEFYVTFVVPSGLSSYFADNYEGGLDLLDRDFTYDITFEFEHLVFDYSSDSWVWKTETVHDTFGASGSTLSSMRNFVRSAEFVDDWWGSWAVVDHASDGLGYLDFNIPLYSVLYDYTQDFTDISGLNESGIFVRNMKITPSLIWDLSREDYYSQLTTNEYDADAVAGLNDLYNVQTYGNHYNNGVLHGLFSGVYYRTHYYFNPIESSLDKYQSVVSSTTITKVGLENYNFVSWIGDTLGGIFDIDLFGTFSLGDVFGAVLAVFLVIIILKFFAGG